MELVIVRHGQASAHARDYDVLSALGERQARLLGATLARQGARFDQVVSGPRKRQIDTATLAIAGAAEVGVTWPAATISTSFDEIPLREILIACLPRWIDEDPVARALHERVHGRHSIDEVKRVLTRAMLTWARGEVTLDGIDGGSFAAFRDRFRAGVDALDGESVLLASSAGPVAVALHLGGDARAVGATETMHLAMEIANASVTRLEWGAHPTVHDANSTAHLPPDDVTYI